MTDTPRFWGDSDRLPLTPFVAADFVEFDMDPTGLNGVHAKVFVRDRAGTAWLLKSGALGDERSTRSRPTPAEERTRRAAFPVHEAIMARLLGTVGIRTADVDVAFRRLLPVDEPMRLRLLVSAHRLIHGRRRDKIVDFQPSAAFLEDLAVAECVNRVVGQRDHRRQNHLVGEDGRFIPVDNGDCMDADWFAAELQPRDFAAGQRCEGAARRLGALTTAAVDAIVAGLPAEAVDWHDAAVGLGHYVPGTLAEKRARLIANVGALRRWAGLD